MTLTISNKLPKTDENGLAHLEGRFAEETDEHVIVVGIVRTDRITDVLHDDNNPRIVKVALLHVEALTNNGDAQKVEKILRGVYQARTGKKELPFEGDDDADAED